MSEYIRNICIFVCLCDFIYQLFLSEKFQGLYKNISGIFIILFLIYPLGRNLVDITNVSDQGLLSQFEENLKKSDAIWSMDTDHIKDESQRLLEQYVDETVSEYEEELDAALPEQKEDEQKEAEQKEIE